MALRPGTPERIEASHWHDLGRWHLHWWSHDGALERAIEALERAASLDPSSATVFSDLAACQLARSVAKNDPLALFAALEAAERAVELDPTLPAARFNRGLALEALFQLDAARSDWRSLLDIDTDSGWIAEARAHLTALDPSVALAEGRLDEAMDRSLDQRDPEELSRLASLDSRSFRAALLRRLPHWLAGDPGRIHALAANLELGNGDLILVDTLEHLASAPVTPELVAGLDGLVEGNRHLQAFETEAARRELRSARAALERAGSPMFWWAEEGLAHCEYQQANYGAAAERSEAIFRDPRGRRYVSLRARSRSLVGLVHALRGRYSEAMRELEESRRLLESTDDRRQKVVIATTLSEIAMLLGDLEGALRAAFYAVRELPPTASPLSAYKVLDHAAILARRIDLPRAGLRLQERAVKLAESSDNLPALAGAYRERALLRAAAGDPSRGLEDADRALRIAASIHDSAVRNVVAASTHLTVGELLGSTDPLRARTEIERAIEIYRATGYLPQVARGRLLLARLAREHGDTDAAELHLREGIAAVEAQRLGVEAGRLRVEYFDQSEELYDELTALEAERSRPLRALEATEQGRGRLLQDWRSGEPAGAVWTGRDWERIGESLPAGLRLVVLTILPDRILAWTIDGAGVRLDEVHGDLPRAERDVAELRRRLARGDEPRSTPSGLTPVAELVESAARGAELLVIVSDKWLHGLPFAALRGSDGRRLVELVDLAVTPSASFFLDGRARRADSSSALVLGDPAPSDAEGLPPLVGSEREAVAVATRLGVVPLLGQSVTEEAFGALAPRHSLVHFTGHAVGNPSHPQWSWLVLSPGPTSDGRLTANELQELDLRDTALVTLSACATAEGHRSATEGPISLARAFLGRGAGAVVASLWEIEDGSTGAFFGSFYDRIVHGETPIAALRSTQIEALERDGSPAVWSAFQVIAGAASVQSE